MVVSAKRAERLVTTATLRDSVKTVKWKCPQCHTEYEIDEKFSKALENKKSCKFCVRKNPDIPTTAELDGLTTPEEMRNRWNVVLQCNSCVRWTEMDSRKPRTPCTAIVNGKVYVDGRKKTIAGCGKINYDSTSMKSTRTYKYDTDNKRKPGANKKRKNEA